MGGASLVTCRGESFPGRYVGQAILLLFARKNQMLRLTAPTARRRVCSLGKTRPPGG